jgi:hypothetical protein
MNWWSINWKSYSTDSLLVNEKQKEYIESEWTKEPENRRSQQFTLAGETYSYNSIDSITRTSSKIDSAIKLLYSEEAKSKSKSAVYNQDREAVTSWYKKSITRKEYDNYYGKHPSYFTLSMDSSYIWVAFRLVKKSNGDRPDNIEPCTEGESERLWQKAFY